MIRDTSNMDQAVAEPHRRRWLPWALGAVAVVALVIAAAPVLSRIGSADDSVDRQRLTFDHVVRDELVFDIGVQGRVVAATRPTLFSPAPGTVSMLVQAGESVVANAVIARVESPELESTLRQERASLEAQRSTIARLELSLRQQTLQNRQQVDLLEVRVAAAERAVKRAESLTELGLINSIELDTARDDLSIQNLELQQARQNLELRRDMSALELRDVRSQLERQQLVVTELERRVDELALRAPFDGMVSEVFAEDRDAVERGEQLVGVVDLGELEVEVSIPEAYADDVSPGLRAVIRHGAEELDGELVRIAPEVRSSQVEGRVAFRGGVPAGMRQNQRLSVRLVLDLRPDTLVVRRGPFVESGGGRHVYVVDGDVIRRQAVALGTISVDRVEIVDGLDAGDQIVLSDLSRFDGAETLLLTD